jgi:large subunit ribosomal protein L5
MNNLYYFYDMVARDDICTRLTNLQDSNIFKLDKISFNIGFKGAINDTKNLIPVLTAMELITVQKPTVTRAKEPISNFNLKKNIPIGCKSTLQGDLMFEFIYKFKSIILPSIKDLNFLLNPNFDNRGNYALGILNLLIFSEIDIRHKDYEFISGMDLVFLTSAKKDIEAKVLLSLFQLPLLKKNKSII